MAVLEDDVDQLEQCLDVGATVVFVARRRLREGKVDFQGRFYRADMELDLARPGASHPDRGISTADAGVGRPTYGTPGFPSPPISSAICGD